MTPTQVIQMYTEGDADSAADVDMPDDGHLLGVEWLLLTASGVADLDAVRAQLSFGSTGAFASNDARQVISNVGWQGELVGAAANFYTSSVMRETYFGDGIQVFAGERVFLHVVVIGSARNTYCYANLICRFKSFTGRRR